jgi:hypothetical protein
MTQKVIKSGKAAGVDGVLLEFLKFLGPKCRKWLTRLATVVAKTSNIPKLWRAVKVIAILKHGKPANEPSSYRPISLLFTVYKFFERLTLNRIQPILENVLPIEQAEFRINRACCDQVLALTTYIDNGYQRKDKLGAVFLDLSSAYNTAWKRGLMLKLAKIIRCKSTLRLIESLLSNRKYNVFLNDVVSRYKYLQNVPPPGICAITDSVQRVHIRYS